MRNTKKVIAATAAVATLVGLAACGSSNSAIELTISELEQYSRFDAWVDVCKGWRAEGEG